MADETVRTRYEIDGAKALEFLKSLEARIQTVAGKSTQLAKYINDAVRAYGQSYNEIEKQLRGISKGLEGGGLTGKSGQSITEQVFKGAREQSRTGQYLTLDPKAKASILEYDGAVKKVMVSLASVRSELAKVAAAGKLNFGKDNAKNVQQVVDVLKQVKGATGASFEQVAAGMRKMGVDGSYLRQALQQVNEGLGETNNKAHQFAGGINVARVAVGQLLATFVSGAVSAVSDFFEKSIEQARRFEDTIYRLKNVEKILSLGGTDISFDNLQKGIDSIKKEMPIFSREDLAETVGAIATTTSELGYSEKQILDLAKAVAVLNVNSTQSETLLQTQSQIITSLISPASRSIGNLGIAFGEAKIEAKAFDMQLLKTGESFKDLTEQEKSMVKLQIVLDRAGQLSGTFGDYLDTNTARLQQNKAAWSDLLTTIGQFFTAITPLVVPFIEVIEDGVNGLKAIVVLLRAVGEIANAFREVNFENLFNPKKMLEGIKETVKEIPNIFKEAMAREAPKFFADMPANAPDWFKDIFGEFLAVADEPTAAVDDLQNAFNSVDTSKAKDALEDLLKSLENLQDKINETEEDYGNKRNRFLEDSTIEQQRMYEDYQLNVLQTQRQFALRRKEHEDKYRQKELEDERKFQEQLRQLQEKFLYNLEDALRERDARQVLRLIDEYNMEKTALINENALRKKASDEQHQIEIDKMEEEEAERLRVLAEEYAVREQRRAEDSALKLQRMDEDHATEMARLEAQKAELLQEAANKIAEEYGLNAEGAQAIYDLLAKYYGTDGALATLTSGGYAAMLNNATGFLSQLTTIIGQYQGLMAQAASMSFQTPTYNPFGLGNFDSTGNPIPGYAKGGAFLATKPTVAQFGEGGEAELVTATPISQLPKLFESFMVGGEAGREGANGRIMVDLNLSPDLEARVVTRAMDGTAEVVSRINKSKGGGF